MLNKLSRKDIELLNILAQTPEGKSALNEYIKQHEKAVKAYKIYRESVVAEVEVDKVVKPVEPKRKFKAGDKVRVLCTGSLSAATLLRKGDIATVAGYKTYDTFPLDAMDGEPLRPVIVRSMVDGGALSSNPTGFFEESALELVEEKTPNELRAEIIEKAKEFVKECRNKKLVTRVNPNGYVVDVSFIVNADKRTVVTLLMGAYVVRAEGIAKCNPDDVFNEHIGKAIALGRALGKDVSEFENAVQPTEPVVGHVVKGYEALGFYRQDRKFTLTSKKDCDSFYYPECNEYDTDSHNDFIYNWQIGDIIDDTNAIYKEVE